MGSTPPQTAIPASLVVLSDSEVQDLCEGLTPHELDVFVDGLATALHDYSTNAQAAESGAYDQPARTTTYQPPTQATTLYMPSSSPGGIGLKIVTTTPGEPATGSVTLMTMAGEPMGFLHARTLTGFRTALASMCLVARRSRVEKIVVFGSGIQAYWHVRLALKLRGSTVRDVHIVNRRYSEGARGLIRTLFCAPAETRLAEGWGETRFSLLTPGYNDYDRLLVKHVEEADVIFCCTPSTEELFPAEALTSKDARTKGRLVVAVGSYTPQMRELPDGLLQQAVRSHEGHRHFHRHVDHGGVIVVDTLDGAMKEAGEIVQGRIDPHQLVELGELVMLHRMATEESDGGDSGYPTPYSEDGIGVSPDTPGSPCVSWAPRRVSFDVETSARQLSRETVNDAQGTAFPSPTLRASTLATSLKNHLPFRNNRPSTSSTSQSQSRASLDPEEPAGQENRHHHHRQGSIGSTSASSSIGKMSRKDRKMVRWLQDGTVIYKSVGFGLMDLVVGMQLIKAAADKGVGAQVAGFSAVPTR